MKSMKGGTSPKKNPVSKSALPGIAKGGGKGMSMMKTTSGKGVVAAKGPMPKAC